VFIFIESRNQSDMDKKRSLNCISQRNPLSPAQGEVAQVKITLRPSCFDKDERAAKKKNQVVKLKFILSVLFPF
jgi:hypothetical protein